MLYLKHIEEGNLIMISLNISNQSQSFMQKARFMN